VFVYLTMGILMTTETTTTTPTIEQLMAMVNDLQAQLKAKPKATSSSSGVKVSMMKLCPTKTGKKMLYFTTPSMVAHSVAKDKEYQASILLQEHQIQPFLASLKDGSLMKLAKAFIDNQWQDTKL
jgi:CRISPR/Cas system endoribonuclease Cas6 (RAMP superfamily)